MNVASNFDLGQAQAAILRNGINLFQLVWPSRLAANDKRIHGPFNVRVSEEDVDDPRRKPRAKIDWFTDGRAHLLFERAPDRRSAVAWMPDDPGWHNRIILMDNPQHLAMVQQLRVRTGEILDAQEVRLEIRCLEDVLKEKIEVYDIYREGRRFGTYKTKAEAEAFIAEENEDLPAVGPDGIFKIQKRKKTNYTINPTFMMDYKPEIAQMIEAEKRQGHQFGWSDNRVFNEEIKPQVIEMIKERRAENRPSMDDGGFAPESILNGMSSWTPEQKRRFREQLFAHDPVRDDAVPPVVSKPKNPLQE